MQNAQCMCCIAGIVIKAWLIDYMRRMIILYEDRHVSIGVLLFVFGVNIEKELNSNWQFPIFLLTQ